jgi:hypothetical protein
MKSEDADTGNQNDQNHADTGSQNDQNHAESEDTDIGSQSDQKDDSVEPTRDVGSANDSNDSSDDGSDEDVVPCKKLSCMRGYILKNADKRGCGGECVKMAIDYMPGARIRKQTGNVSAELKEDEKDEDDDDYYDDEKDEDDDDYYDDDYYDDNNDQEDGEDDADHASGEIITDVVSDDSVVRSVQVAATQPQVNEAARASDSSQDVGSTGGSAGGSNEDGESHLLVFFGLGGGLFVLVGLAAFIKNARNKKERRRREYASSKINTENDHEMVDIENNAGDDHVAVDITNPSFSADKRQEWEKHVAPDGRPYYSNRKSGEVSWTLPEGANLVGK